MAVAAERRPCFSGFSFFFPPINVLLVFCYVFVFVFCGDFFVVVVFLDGQESSRSFSSNFIIIAFKRASVALFVILLLFSGEEKHKNNSYKNRKKYKNDKENHSICGDKKKKCWK